MEITEGDLKRVNKRFLRWGGLAMISLMTTSCCCCQDCCQRMPPVAKPRVIEEHPKVPEKKGVEPQIIPRPEGKQPIRKKAPEIKKIPTLPKGELIREPYHTTRADFIVPFSEMCILKEEPEEQGEDKIDWGFITPWLYKE